MMVSINVGFLYMAVFDVSMVSVYGDVKIVQIIVFFRFCCEL